MTTAVNVRHTISGTVMFYQKILLFEKYVHLSVLCDGQSASKLQDLCIQSYYFISIQLYFSIHYFINRIVFIFKEINQLLDYHVTKHHEMSCHDIIAITWEV